MDYKNMLAQLHQVAPPIQPWLRTYMKDFNEKLVDWNPFCVKNRAIYYQFTTTERTDLFVELLPDACINFLFKCSKENPNAFVSGIHEGSSKINLEPNTTYFGFKPYSVVGIKNLETTFAELKNKTVALNEILPAEEVITRVVQGKDLKDRIKAFQNYAISNLIRMDYIPSFVEYCAILVCLAGGNISLDEIERQTGYTQRYCREKFKDLNGISIKQYSRIVRFQKALRMIIEMKTDNVSDITFNAGYFDQSHFIKEFKGFTDTSPLKFRNTYMSLNRGPGTLSH